MATTPDNWPPQPGDVWVDRDGDPWFAVFVDNDELDDDERVYIKFLRARTDAPIEGEDVDDCLNWWGPWSLAYRHPAPAEQDGAAPMADPMSDEPLRDRIARKLAEWAFQAAETKGVKLTSFHRHIIGQEAPERADMVMEVVRPELERLRERERYLQETADAAVSGWKKADRRAAHHEDRAEKLGRQLRATRAERQQAEAERDRLAEQVKRAEDVCVLLGWTANPMDTDRTKALHQLWSEWVRTKPDGYMDPANHPDLSDEVIERLAHKRDEIRARTLAAVRDDGTEAGQ